MTQLCALFATEIRYRIMSLDTVVLVAQVLVGVLTVGTVLAELTMLVARKRRDYRFGDTLANFATSLGYAALGGLALLFILPVYEAIRTHFALFEIEPDNAMAWILGFVLTDFCHYWFHRAAHRNNFLWGIHQGHHSSEDFNLSIAVRKGIFQQWVDWPFFLPMALIGFPFFTMYLPLKGAQFAYQFWIHNQFIGKLGVLEKIIVTPSLHRVHHGQNPQYIDKNYAGVFILWDWLFGSYEEERERVVYGIGTPVRTFNPMTMQFVYWRQLWLDARASVSKWDRIKIWFMPTGWRPESQRSVPWPGKIQDVHVYEKYNPQIDLTTKVYSLVQFVALGVLTMRIGGNYDSMATFANNVLAMIFSLWTAWSIGLVLDGNAEWRKFEIVRSTALAACAAVAVVVQQETAQILSGALLAISVASLGFLSLHKGPQPTAAIEPT
jgi:alkylglycerol monooxygenase